MPLFDELEVRLKRIERENQRLRRSVQELSLLNDLAREIGTSFSTEDIMQSIVRRAIRSVQAEQGVIKLVEEQTNDPMVTLVRTGGSDGVVDPFRMSDSLLGWMMFHKRPLLVDDPPNDERFKGASWNPAIHSVLCVPLLVRSRLIGILTVYNNTRTPSGFTEDDQRLLSIIAAQSAQIIENARLHEEEKALIGMREQVRLAKEIQQALLPQEPPQILGYDIAGLSIPAQSVGGDYFDFIPLENNRLALGVADVSGKGLPASLLMANVQATLQGQAPWSPSVAECVNRVNKFLCRRTRKGSFVTMFYGSLDYQQHHFAYANAGHNKPLLRTKDGSVKRLELGGLMLGFLPAATYEEAHHTFAPGDTLLIYSDGIPEAMNADREQFDEPQMMEYLAQAEYKSAKELVDGLVEQVQTHTGNLPPSDDMTLIAIRRL